MANIPELVLALQAEATVEEEMAQRPTKVCKPMVIRTGNRFKDQPGFLVQGTVVTVIGRRGSRYLKDLLQAIKAGDSGDVQRASDIALERAEAGLRFIEEPFEVRSASAIVDVTYGRSFLAKHVVLSPTTDLAISYAVWSGGPIDEGRFSVLEYPSIEGRDTDVEVLIVLVDPRLSKIENSVLKAVPVELSDIHIQGPSVAWTTVLTIGGVPQNVVQIGGPELQVGGPEPERGMNRLGFPLRLVTRLVGGPFGQAHQRETTVDQVQQQQEDTKQQQQQQQVQQADTKQQQQQQQQQQQDNATKQQQQQQQARQDNQQQQKQQDQRQQQQQEQQRQTDQRQQQQQDQREQNVDRQQDQRQDQHQQERQAQTRVREDQHARHQHQDRQTAVQQEWSKVLGDLMRQGLALKPFDNEKYKSLLEAIDFASMDATQSVKELLRLREELLKEGLG